MGSPTRSRTAIAAQTQRVRSAELSAVAGLVLAAGGGRRLGGGPKALLQLDGVTLVERAVATARDGGCDPVVVVLGAAADRVRAEVDLGDSLVVVNRAWSTGMGSSLRAGLAALGETEAQTALVLLVDMPGVTAAAIRRIAALPYPDALVCATYDGRRGHPMLLGREHWAGIATLATADVGARPYLLAHKTEVLEIACDDIADGTDIDTPEDAARLGITVPRAQEPSGGAEPSAARAASADRAGVDDAGQIPRPQAPVAAAVSPRPPGSRPSPRPRR